MRRITDSVPDTDATRFKLLAVALPTYLAAKINVVQDTK